MSEKIIIPSTLVPIRESALNTVNFSKSSIAVALKPIIEETHLLSLSSDELSISDARRIECAIQVQNIKSSITSIDMYLGIIQMLLDNIQTDIDTIREARKQFCDEYTKRMEAKLNAERQQKFRDTQKESAENEENNNQ